MEAEHRETSRCYAAGSEDGGRGHKPGVQVASKLLKRQRHNSPLEPPERTSHIDTLICVV